MKYGRIEKILHICNMQYAMAEADTHIILLFIVRKLPLVIETYFEKCSCYNRFATTINNN